MREVPACDTPVHDTAVSFEAWPASLPELHAPAAECRSAAGRRSVLGAIARSLLPASLSQGMRVATPASATEPVRIVYDIHDNTPLICGNGTEIDPVKPGLSIELLRMASARANIPITLSRVPWERGLYLIQTGQADAIFASSYVQDRLRYGVYPMKNGQPDTSRKLFDQSYRLYVRAGSDVHWDGKTLTNLHAPVGATTGYAVVPVLRAMGVPVEEEMSHVADLHKLVAGRLDAYAELETHIRPMLRSNKAEFGGIVELSPPLRTAAYYLMFSKISYARAPDVAERIWNAIAEVNDSAAYRALLASSKYAD
ncbi:ABC transporter substrate-binding protein [Acidisphaera sp. S103]|uniref:substrate-binding periplasmic protein n=1 Tax=Acidisphaera sp. S103 TaxID=1747223 RepID=UPI001C204370|nr:transporter substrate-binding domain-containing protein [Acidisphaera sp. S103]